MRKSSLRIKRGFREETPIIEFIFLQWRENYPFIYSFRKTSVVLWDGHSLV